MAGVYIHIPFCRQSCIYCNFYFKNGKKHAPDFFNALFKELDIKFHNKTVFVETLYFGGGTPSFADTAHLEALVNHISKKADISRLKEFTLEANPDDMSMDNLLDWKKLGVNRLSVGVQSFFDEHLSWMNRAHSSQEAIDALNIAGELGFELSIDLIFGIPSCTMQQWKENLDKALRFKISHISCYGLTLEEKTPWKKLISTKGYDGPDDTSIAEQFTYATEFLQGKGWVHYEISNYSLPGKEAIHNTSYWQSKEYIGFGPSAHSYDGEKRSWNVSDLNAYVESLDKGIVPEESEILSREDRYNEYVMTSLRTKWGMDLTKLKTIADVSDENLEKLERFVAESMLHRDGETYILTKQGKLYADSIASELFF